MTKMTKTEREDRRQIGALYTHHRDMHYQCAAALRLIETLAEDAADALRHDGDGLLYLDVARERIQSIRNSVNKALSE
jgi:hypothetical protein